MDVLCRGLEAKTDNYLARNKLPLIEENGKHTGGASLIPSRVWRPRPTAPPAHVSMR